MADERLTRRLIVASLIAVFGLGMVFAIMALRMPRRSPMPPSSPVAVDPGLVADPAGPETSTPSVQTAQPGLSGSIPGDGTAVAPNGYPIKGNGRSGIYHVPGGFAYDRTVASICFQSVEAAQAAGYRASKS